jgi:hypothetical protein
MPTDIILLSTRQITKLKEVGLVDAVVVHIPVEESEARGAVSNFQDQDAARNFAHSTNKKGVR